MRKRKPRIFIGINEVGDFTLNLAQGFRDLGYAVTNVAFYQNTPILQHRVKHDRYIKIRSKYVTLKHLQRFTEFCRIAPFHDIFIFIFSESFFPSHNLMEKSGFLQWLAYRDLPILKAMGKKVIIIANGCDVRHYTATEKKAQEDGFKYHVCFDCDLKENCSLPLKKKKVGIIERYADHIFADPTIAVLFKRGFFNILAPINLSKVHYAFTSTDNPLILHAPTNRSIKGTKYILEALERLRREGYRFRLLLCENMTNVKVREKLAESEIVVDQLLARGQGLFAVEAMASGNVVLNHVTPGLYGFPPELPVITANPDTIYDKLKMVLENPDLRLQKAREGRAYVEKYHDHVVAARKFLTQIGTSYPFEGPPLEGPPRGWDRLFGLIPIGIQEYVTEFLPIEFFSGSF